MDSDTFERFSALDFSSQGEWTERDDLFSEFRNVSAGKRTDVDLQLITALRKLHPELIITATPTSNIDLLKFAAAGFATAELDLNNETVLRWRGFIPPPQRGGGEGHLVDAMFFACYRYRWGEEDFLLYRVTFGLTTMQYILKEPRGGEKVQSHSRVTDALLSAIGTWSSIEPDALYVFDRYWTKSTALWKEVQKASWDKVILDPKMKKELVEVCDRFFDSEDQYKEVHNLGSQSNFLIYSFGVPWKRGLIFHGPPGNGKTISIKALMHSMYQRKNKIPCLYVKSAPYTYMIQNVFALARQESPCLLIFEDIDTIVTPTTRSYFFNEVDGVANNDGIMMIASTNYLDKLDPGLRSRPSRFDRLYLFPLPNRDERTLYAEFWREKVKGKPIDFPLELCPRIADITNGFSFAYLQELFIASMLVLARDEAGGSEDDDKGDDEFDKYKLWRVLKEQAAILRENLGREDGQASAEPMLPIQAEPHGGLASEYVLPKPVHGIRSELIREAGLVDASGLRRLQQPTHGYRLGLEQALNALQYESQPSVGWE